MGVRGRRKTRETRKSCRLTAATAPGGGGGEKTRSSLHATHSMDATNESKKRNDRAERGGLMCWTPAARLPTRILGIQRRKRRRQMRMHTCKNLHIQPYRHRVSLIHRGLPRTRAVMPRKDRVPSLCVASHHQSHLHLVLAANDVSLHDPIKGRNEVQRLLERRARRARGG